MSLWPDLSNDPQLSDHQKVVIARATAGPVGMLTGAPGTGKTFTVAALVRRVIAEYGRSTVRIAAPTGKAAVRATQAMRANGIDIPATTIHRLLEIGRNGHDGDGWDFLRGPGNPLDAKFLVVDEFSMVDTDLAADLLDALAVGTHLLIVGDAFQLPPVGHGAPLRDLIAAGVPHGELTEVRRNAGQIVHACVRIKNGESFDVCDGSPDLAAVPPRNLKLFPTRDESHSAEVLVRLLGRMAGFDPVWQTQVIVARNAKGVLSRTALNDLLHPLLNPDGHAVPGNPFKVGDKIICTRNSRMHRVEPVGEFHAAYAAEMARDAANYQPVYLPAPDGGPSREPEEVFVANGEIGRVVAVGPKLTVARFSEGEALVRIPMGKQRDDDGPEADGDADQGRGCNFDLAYAITVHKCVHPDTLVETAEGLLPIRLLADTGTVATPEGPASYPTRVLNPLGAAVRVGTQHGYEITVTPDHGVEVWDGAGYVRREAVDLQPGDWLRLRLGSTVDPPAGGELPPAPPRDVRTIAYRLPTRVTEDVAEFFGLMVADGTVYDSGFRLLKRHPEVAERFGDLCRHLFGCNPAPLTIGGATGYEVHSRSLADWLIVVGGLSPNAKAVPEAVLRSPVAMHRRFLRGLFEDGTVNMRGDVCDHIEWVTAYPDLARVVHTMLLRCGIFGTRTTRTAHSARFTHDVIYLYGEAAATFRDTIGFISPFKQDRLAGCRTGNTKYVLPANRNRAPELRRSVGKSAGDNLLTRGTVSRDVARRAGWTDELGWFHTRVRATTPTTCPSMCLEVPAGHRFLQNGFPFWNCQGSESPCVIVMADPDGGRICDRAWWYTAISRASKLCVLIGQLGWIDKQRVRQSLVGRKTFLKDLLTELREVPGGENRNP